jgi:hypothetical protein
MTVEKGISYKFTNHRPFLGVFCLDNLVSFIRIAHSSGKNYLIWNNLSNNSISKYGSKFSFDGL